jgi:hypothetical protein
MTPKEAPPMTHGKSDWEAVPPSERDIRQPGAMRPMTPKEAPPMERTASTYRVKQRRDRSGHFVKTCNSLVNGETACGVRAQWYVEGFGAFGLYGMSGQATMCKRHCQAAVRRMNDDVAYKGHYKAVKVSV